MLNNTEPRCLLTHILHLAPANGIRGYTNEVRLRGLTRNQGFGTRAGGFCLCSRDFSRLVQDMS
ncbi:hypothetical protein [Nostoc sp. FACHB-110]|uniref:hypothetical protein n=1 Tax=Nostoc sp. FACHB-110 TaxID=2692834 RepID=UPI001686863A|nr:hypothetical protein [Nostoc sp. FACHB-110]MBD2439437.1 hypothetical protein [Nostoc sp. FACHB-110]